MCTSLTLYRVNATNEIVITMKPGGCICLVYDFTREECFADCRLAINIY